MVRKRRKKRTTKIKHPKKQIEEEYYEIIEFICPHRGLVRQKIKVKKLKTIKNNLPPLVQPCDDLDKVLRTVDDQLTVVEDPSGTENGDGGVLE